jgi:hypothetical protein
LGLRENFLIPFLSRRKSVDKLVPKCPHGVGFSFDAFRQVYPVRVVRMHPVLVNQNGPVCSLALSHETLLRPAIEYRQTLSNGSILSTRMFSCRADFSPFFPPPWALVPSSNLRPLLGSAHGAHETYHKSSLEVTKEQYNFALIFIQFPFRWRREKMLQEQQVVSPPARNSASPLQRFSLGCVLFSVGAKLVFALRIPG